MSRAALEAIFGDKLVSSWEAEEPGSFAAFRVWSAPRDAALEAVCAVEGATLVASTLRAALASIVLSGERARLLGVLRGRVGT